MSQVFTAQGVNTGMLRPHRNAVKVLLGLNIFNTDVNK